MQNRTKIVATVGPASDTLEMIEKLILAGVNVFRLNFSHGSYAYHEKVLENIRAVMQKTGLIVGVLQDISGPKIRIGELDKCFELLRGDILEFVSQEILGHQVEKNHYKLSLSESEILKKLQIGDYIYLYDGIIRAKVFQKEQDSLCAVIENDGLLSSKKGVNFPKTHLGVEVLTQKDREDIAWGVKNGVDFMAISFVQSARDMNNAREIVKMHGGEQLLIAKIEKFDAIENIDAILEASDGLMVARGDLGIEVPFYEVPSIQKMLIKKANSVAKPVITATQMLLSMTKSQRATRAEISDIANAVWDGTDAVMLSEESAVGDFAELCVQTMYETICESEKSYAFHDYEGKSGAIDEAAVRLSKSLGVAGILALTDSGNSARNLAKYRPEVPIYAVTHSQRVRHQLTLSWGVKPFHNTHPSSVDEMLKRVVRYGVNSKTLSCAATYIFTAGDPVGVSGSTNMIRHVRGHEMEFYLR